jgi:hypothetical protein
MFRTACHSTRISLEHHMPNYQIADRLDFNDQALRFDGSIVMRSHKRSN